jgi:hypoxanthine phosphoribosyltransferase
MGNTYAAKSLIETIVKPRNIEEIVTIAKLNKAIIVPIYSIEKAGFNKIPLAYGTYLSNIAKLKVADIIQNNKVFHTGGTALNRLITKPKFTGPVYPENHIIVDDVITSGSTIMALKYYIESNGGKVVLVSSIATAFSPQTGHSSLLEISQETYQLLYTKFKKNDLNQLLLQYEIIHKDIDEISNSQAKYLSTFTGIDNLRIALAKVRVL